MVEAIKTRKKYSARVTDLICYCFGFTARDITEDVIANEGRPLVLEEIASGKRQGVCRCEMLHPERR